MFEAYTINAKYIEGRGFIQVHHIKPLSEIKVEYKINPIEDLRLVYPNCHAILDKRISAYSIEEIKTFIKNVNSKIVK